jgi:hypothetical protein
MHISFQQVVANQTTVVEKINVSSFAFCSENELLNLGACSEPLHHAQWHHHLRNMGVRLSCCLTIPNLFDCSENMSRPRRNLSP